MMLRSLVQRFSALFSKRRLERELDDEIQTHIEMAAEENLRRGMSPEAARREAYRNFGAIEAMKDRYRDARSLLAVESLLRDARLSVRMLVRTPGNSAITITTLALGIAAVTAISAFFHDAVLRPLPFRNPGELVMIWTTIPSQNIDQDGSSYPNHEDWRTSAQVFRDMALVSRAEAGTLLGAEEPEAVRVGRVSANVFSVLGVSPMLGRVFSQDEVDDRARVVVLSHRFWRSRFGGSSQVIGRTLLMDGGRSQVIGVMPAEFRFPSKDIQMWEPHTLAPYWPKVRNQRGSDLYKIVARLRPDLSVEDAQRSMDQTTHRIRIVRNDVPAGLGVKVVSLSEQMTSKTVRIALALLFASVIGILLIACTNVAGLLLARGVMREREFAIRAAIGGSRAQLIRQLLFESLALAIIAGLLGIVLGGAMIRSIERNLPLDLPHVENIHLDIPVVAFSFGLALLTVIVCGIFPALRLSATSPNRAMKGGRSSVLFGRSNLRKFLVIGELGLATVLLVGTILLLRSFINVKQTHPGFEADRVLAVRAALPASYDVTRGAAYFREAIERLKVLPGVASVGAIHQLFFEYNPDTVITVEGRTPPRPDELMPQLIGDAVLADCFETLGVALLRGRMLSDRDVSGAPTVTVINETMARTFFPGEDPIGKRFTFGASPPTANTKWITVVGVVGDMRRRGLETPVIPQMFGTRAQFPNNRMDILVRTSSDPEALGSTIRKELRELDAAPILGPVIRVRDGITQFHSWRRFQSALLSGFALLALCLATIGIYGLLQQLVLQRKKEIGVRMALGARTDQVQNMILRQALALAVIGLAIGLMISIGTMSAIRSLLFGVSEYDPRTMVLAIVLLLGSAAAAGYLPARRAARMDPSMTLRDE